MQFYKKGFIILGLIFLVIYGAHRFSYAWFTHSSACIRCHEIEPYAASWEKSPHSNIDCRDCHETRGPFSRLDTTVRGVRDIVIHLKGRYSFPMRAVVYDTNCINCHLGIFKPETNAPLLPKGHAGLIKNGVGCNNCHRDTGHENGLEVEAKLDSIIRQK